MKSKALALETKNKKTCNDSRLLELADKEVLKKILRSFSESTGLTANIVDTEGRSIFGAMDAQKNCKFCQLVWQYQKGFERCRKAYVRAGKQAFKFGIPYIFRCPAGLIEWAAPLIIDEEHVGSIICGQVLMWEPEDFFWIELEEMNDELNIDMEQLKKAAKELRVISGDKVEAAADLLFVTANYVMKTGWENLRHQQQIVEQRMIITDEMEQRKKLEAKLDSCMTGFNSYYEKEKQLIGEVKLGNSKKAKKLLWDMLVDLIEEGNTNIEDFRAIVTELVVVLSRVAVENGAESSTIRNINRQIFVKINSSVNVDDFILNVAIAIDDFINVINNNAKVKNHKVLNDVKSFIHENYVNNISLEEIAESVFLSPGHLCRLFKKELGTTVMDYLIKVRLEEAKKLLRNPKYKIDEIASCVGYKDSSHFAKVFRRVEKISPTEYRQQA